MDFTSDVGSTATPPRRKMFVSSSDSDGSDLLDPQEQELLKLQDVKDALLAERSKKLAELESLQKKLQHTLPREVEATDVVPPDANGDNLLVDLIVMSSHTREAQYEQKVHIDGSSGVQEELKWKYDTLPIMNMRARLHYLTDLTYPHASVDIEHTDATHIYIHYQFHKFAARPLEITISGEIVRDTDAQNEQLTNLQFYDVSSWFKLILRSIIPQDFVQGFPHAILFYCHEFDRLQFERYQLINFLRDKYGKRLRVSARNIDASVEIVELQSLKDIDALKLSIEFSIASQATHHNTQSLNYYYPRLNIHLMLSQYGQEIKSIDEIFIKLINLYGIQVSLQRLIDQIMF